MTPGGQDSAYRHWHQLSSESNGYLDSVGEELVQSVNVSP